MSFTQDSLAVKKCQEGNLDQFAGLYDKYLSKIYNFIYYKTFHKETTEDLTSKTFMKALENIDKFNSSKGKFSSWLYRIARNLVIDYYRTKKNVANIDDIYDLIDDTNILKNLQDKEKLQEAKKFLEKLSEEQKEIVIMRVWNEMSYKEIAEITGKSEGNCKVIFSRVMRSMNKEIAPLILIMLII
jgi:RNA polymerase sigma factor (sigma-70 family)